MIASPATISNKWEFYNIHPTHFVVWRERVALHHRSTLRSPQGVEKFTGTSYVVEQSTTRAIVMNVFQQTVFEQFFCFPHILSGIIRLFRLYMQMRVALFNDPQGALSLSAYPLYLVS